MQNAGFGAATAPGAAHPQFPSHAAGASPGAAGGASPPAAIPVHAIAQFMAGPPQFQPRDPSVVQAVQPRAMYSPVAAAAPASPAAGSHFGQVSPRLAIAPPNPAAAAALKAALAPPAAPAPPVRPPAAGAAAAAPAQITPVPPAPDPAAPLGVETWTECEAAGCGKWRRLNAPPADEIKWVCAMNPDPRFNSCAAPQELSNDEIDRRMDALAAGVPLAPVYYAPPPHPAPRGNKKANAAKRGRAAVDDFEGYQPPPRQNARGERTLGQQLPPGGYPPPKQPKQGGKAWEKEEARRQAKAKAEAKKAAEAEEEARWEPPAGFEMGAEREAMLRLLRELFQPRHHAFTQPFVDVTAPEHGALTANLVDIRTKFFAGGFTTLAAFALEVRARRRSRRRPRLAVPPPPPRPPPPAPSHPAALTPPPQVREVFAHCYRAHGHPDASLLSRKCERVDALFEQQVALLNRTLRELASIANARNAVQSGDGGGDDGDGPAGERRSSRASRGSSVLSTLQMVELEKRQEQGRQEAAKREERERERAEAEAWADREVAAVDLKEVRGCYDAVSATHWLLSLGEALGLAAFCPTEFEMALSLERPERCSVVRSAIHTLLSATKPPSSKDRAASRGGAPPGPPGEYALCGALADRIELWRSLRKSAEEAEQDEHRYLFPEQLRPYTEIGEMAELLDGLGDDLGAVAAQLRAHGLGALDLGQMARLLRLLCEQALMTTPRLRRPRPRARCTARRASSSGSAPARRAAARTRRRPASCTCRSCAASTR